ncbi:acyltransferase [Candidatus Acetothermia bacterium]|nr:acyltransferase [Candidatus Acetothermia bacterium]
MRVGYVQTAPRFGEVERNLCRVQALMSIHEKVDLWVLPELFVSGYQFVSRAEMKELAETIPDGPTTQQLIRLAQQQNSHIVAGIAEKKGGYEYNAAILVGPAGLLSHYRKLHLFAEEKEWFSPGNTPFPVSSIPVTDSLGKSFVKIGIMICFDHLFPEAARTLAIRGAEIIAHPANLVIPGYGQLTMKVRAMENRVFTVTANRIGTEARTEKRLHFTGESQIISPCGDLLVSSANDIEDVQVVEIDPALARNKMLTPNNDLFADRRPEFYFH